MGSETTLRELNPGNPAFSCYHQTVAGPDVWDRLSAPHLTATSAEL